MACYYVPMAPPAGRDCVLLEKHCKSHTIIIMSPNHFIIKFFTSSMLCYSFKASEKVLPSPFPCESVSKSLWNFENIVKKLKAGYALRVTSSMLCYLFKASEKVLPSPYPCESVSKSLWNFENI